MQAGNTNCASIREALDAFVSAFNDNDLDRVMTHFSPDAVYLPGDGSEHRGLAEIRAAFAPQFAGAFGTMRFDEHDRLVDEPARKAAIRWVCRHDLDGAKTPTFALAVQKIAVSLTVGKRFGWEGLDIFHFDASGKIVGKFTYANYSRPRIRADLGVPLASALATPTSAA